MSTQTQAPAGSGRPEAVTTTPAIEISGLTKTYGGADTPSVDNVSLSVPAGTVFGFLGPNGAGKTTTIKILSGLLAASSGKTLLNGYDVTRQRAAAMQQFGAVLEGSRNVYWTLSAWQNLLYFGRLKGMTAAHAAARAEELLKGLDLWERREESVGGYSRGMQQKVAVAAALIADPPIVLLDEPTIGLDVEATRTVMEWIRTLSRERGKTVLLTTHQMNVVEELCDRVAVIRKGKVIADMSTDQLLSQFRERDAYEVRIEGDLPELSLPPNFTARRVDDTTIVSGRVSDPQEVYTLVDRLRDQRAVVQSLAQVQPDLEDVFMGLIKGPAHD
ncbi:daunorubicin resistance protein DrrA family ABC transporter ATP-binding protein [Streptomyces spiroverticillatus]|uniref:Daunorubicin resistance protein DrrA family ABC transporter ATP-binding protein n=1 Tax=Streptomyces finlayi TaxID=67296 RepID=A0A918X9E6_9ACTN|nr:ABC transporter ATP-binding protein [Streptomyces finlayi]GHA44263.1 daunorubicin resistance protein DrrA family ABC transporter ATP-binding protein [Streptomyces spiroverticillatus]GHD17731.1 daunorubicin resistance protein DrrA family ABC transporter ATP-binding protein [Streptomyces finlayi]